MMVLNGAVLLLSAAAAVTVPSHVPSQGLRRVVKPETAVTYQASQIEAYLTKEQVEYIRPGYNIELLSFEIPADGRPLATVKLTDDMGQPLDREGKITPGPCSASFILAWYDAARRDYVSYTTTVQKSPITQVSATQAAADSGGTWTRVELGTYTYKFRTALPTGYDKTKTHTVGIYGSRNLAAIIEKTYYDNVLYDFRPDGAAVTDTWNAVATATCNSCHDPLALHGGARREVKLCVLCHNTTQSLDPDTGNNVQMAEMTHKIHFGPNLTKGYTIIGYQQAVHDYSHVTYPQDVRNCTTCHKPSAPEGHIWYSNPSRQACGSCHDSINWETGENHDGGAAADDSACSACHQPEGEFEFDASVKGAHVIPTKSAQLRGLGIEILDVEGAAPGGKITVSFRTYNLDDGSFVPPSTLNSCNFLLGGPTADYTSYVRGDARAATVKGETATYTFTNVLPTDAMGTWALSADVYRNVRLNPGPSAAVREAAQNPFRLVAVTDAQPIAHRAIVDLAKCNKCHDVLALHGGQRFKIEECVICHNPVETDASWRPADKRPAESVHMKYMIHKIHTGEQLERDYTVYGYGGNPYTFNEVVYPGDRRNCEACHKPNSYGLPLPEEALPTPTLRDWYTPMQAGAAACLSCHSSLHAAAHAYVNNAPFGEACASCHGAGREFSVVRSHAR
ncbi:MAG TPA: OmcA/MtrC family decaheme c-type cytochrome [Thermoanaerobaculaceae bacterium]|mgnify:CR=1 FL=1|nr:OmcA/MtrC family decaheme c-type cytochrome [Thermoanaerobaculaceae bacterium]